MKSRHFWSNYQLEEIDEYNIEVFDEIFDYDRVLSFINSFDKRRSSTVANDILRAISNAGQTKELDILKIGRFLTDIDDQYADLYAKQRKDFEWAVEYYSTWLCLSLKTRNIIKKYRKEKWLDFGRYRLDIYAGEYNPDEDIDKVINDLLV